MDFIEFLGPEFAVLHRGVLDKFDLLHNVLHVNHDVTSITSTTTWLTFFKRGFDVVANGEPFVVKMLLVQPETGAYAARILGKTSSRGVLRSADHFAEVGRKG